MNELFFCNRLHFEDFPFGKDVIEYLNFTFA